MNSEDREVFRQVWSAVPSAPEEGTEKKSQEDRKKSERRSAAEKPARDYSDENRVIDELSAGIAESWGKTAEDEDLLVRFDPRQLNAGRLGFQYKDQLRKLYGEIVRAMPYIQQEKADKEFRTIVQAERNRIRRYGKQVASVLKTSIDIEKEKIWVNTWLETEYAAGRCPIHRFYQMPKHIPSGQDEDESGRGKESGSGEKP